MEPKELFGNDYDEFCEVDPYNQKNEVQGYISRKSTEYYGALIITKINNQKVPEQLIMGTPKMHYPFVSRADGTRDYIFPSVHTIEVYEKLDGTNILAYHYHDNSGQRYLTFKTRLRPFVNAGSRWGNFFEMWNEVVSNPQLQTIKQIMHDWNCNLSFELWGSRNPHLVMYKESLAFSLLFGVTNTGRILSPSVLPIRRTLPVVPLLTKIDKDYVWNYEQLQKELNSGLSQVEDNYYTGVEGTVWYMHYHDGRCVQVKCKPEIIEAIHFSAGKGINKQVILATCWNALENTDTLTVEFVKQLLAEEFKPELVESEHYQIEKCIGFVNGELEFRQKVLEEYHKLGMNINLHKSEVMRALSDKFDRSKMRKVYGAIRDFA